MDLSKLSGEQKLFLCRWYFRAGFAFLPFMWFINACWFFEEAIFAPPFEEQQQIKKYVRFSIWGATIWTILLLAWIITYQTQRVSWGDFGDAISYTLPIGMP